MKPVLYLAGPMSGIADFNYPLFNRIARVWRTYGYRVLNPAENYGGDTGRTRAEYIAADIPLVLKADALIVLPDWEGSVGTRHEMHLAQLMEKSIYDAMLYPLLLPLLNCKIETRVV